MFLYNTATNDIYTLSLHDALPIFTSAVSIVITFIASKLLLGDFKDAAGAAQPALWWVLSCIISCGTVAGALIPRSEEHTSELQSQFHLVCRLLLEKKKLLLFYATF